MKLRKLPLFGLLIISLCVTGTILNINAKDKEQAKGPELTDYFTIINEDGTPEIVKFDEIDQDDSKVEELTKEYDVVANYGNKKETIKTYDNKNEAEKAVEIKKYYRSRTNYSVEERTKDITYGVVYLKSEDHNGKSYLTYDNVSNPGYDGYTTGSFAKDAAYIGTVDGKVRAMQAGVIMDFDSRDVTIVDYEDANISYYYVQNGYLYHKFYYGSSNSSNTYRVGYKLSYLSAGKKYYSYDGHYFYTSYPTMIKDYQNNVRTHSINKSNPYYNYYQYLSHRSTTNLTANKINSIIDNKVGSSTSKMKNLGNYYIEYQNTYGSNALLMLGVSANESAWGRSSIAMDKNNLFGHGAVDSNPYYGANGYNTPSDSIKYHAEKFISNGYLDNEDWRYNGGYLGDKLSGIGVRYASDPYWGEKGASVYYYNDSGLTDYGRYTIGIINGVQKSYKLYKEPSYSSHVTHVLGIGKSPRTADLAVIILGNVTDSSGNKWYKIQSDTALNSARTNTEWNNQYSFNRDYLYIPASHVTIVEKGDSNVAAYLPGDVNGDGKVSAMDYIAIENHIMGRSLLANNSILRADVNQDGKVSAMDYIAIENHIMGREKLF